MHVHMRTLQTVVCTSCRYQNQFLVGGGGGGFGGGGFGGGGGAGGGW